MIGAQIGTYRVLRQIGEGGMGAVWLAEHVMLGRMVAIKVLHRETSMNPDVVARFFNEARAATAISDPGIIQIFDFGHHVDGSAYIVMEFLEGETLEHRLQRLGRLALAPALRIQRQIAASLGAAHQRGIVHRDIKPENVFLVKDPEVPGGERTKILDFGIAKLSLGSGLRTQTSIMMGTPAYMSPEQCRGAGQVDQRSDVYSLGCLLFALLTGRPPFWADGAGEIIAMHLREAPPVPSAIMPGIPPLVDALVLRCLAKDREQRFGSGAELAVAIGRLLGDPQVQPFLVDPVVTGDVMAEPSWSRPLSAPLVRPADGPAMAPAVLRPNRPEFAPPPEPAFPSGPEQPALGPTLVGTGPGSSHLPLSGAAGHAVVGPRNTTLTSSSSAVATPGAGGARPGRRWVAWLAGSLIVAGGAGVVLMLRGGSDEPAVTAPVSDVASAAPPEVASATPPEVASAAPPEVASAAPPEVASAAPPEVASAAPSEVAPDASPVDAPAPSSVERSPSEVSAAFLGAIERFHRWRRLHRSEARCPTLQELPGVDQGGPLVDELRITCLEQPKDQRIGVIWAGRDGSFGTGDDVRSWDLGSGIVKSVRGPRWGKPARAGKTSSKDEPLAPQFIDLNKDGIPDVR